MLMSQMREAIAAALREAGANPKAATWQAALRARFRYLPPAGELPVGMLLQPLTPTPTPAPSPTPSPTPTPTQSCPFFPAGMEVYLQFIRASQAPHLLYQALGRPPLDLASNNAEAVTLSLAVPDAAWTPDLIDVPRGDPVLAADLHLAYARARAAQVVEREAWIALYGGISATLAAQPQALGFLINVDAAAKDLFFLLNPPSSPTPTFSPLMPTAF